MSGRAFVPVRVPSEADFGEDGADFLDDPLLDRLLLDVVGAYPALRHIEDHGISVRALWKRKGGKSHGSLTYAKCVKPSGLLAHFCKVDFVIWVAADGAVFLQALIDEYGDVPMTEQLRLLEAV